MADPGGWQVVISLGAAAMTAAAALVGHGLGRRSAKKALEQAKVEYSSLQDRWMAERKETSTRWSRERTLDLLEKALTRAMADDDRAQSVGVAQLGALWESQLLQSEDKDLVAATIRAVLAGVGSGVNVLDSADDDDVEFVVDDYSEQRMRVP